MSPPGCTQRGFFSVGQATRILVFAGAALLGAGCPRVQRVEPPKPTPTPSPTPVLIPFRKMETSRMFNGLKVNATVEADYGHPSTSATADREEPGSYTLELIVKVRVPKASISLAALTALNDHLPSVLPGLESMLPTATVADFFDEMYRRKVTTIQRDLVRLDQLLSRHNFYDCETILNLQHPKIGRRAVFFQADMDVVTDGSDGDRVAAVDSSSLFFQPTTSYRWPKKTATPNPFLAGRVQKVKQAEQELAKAAPGSKAQELKATLARLKAEEEDLRKNSFLIASADPFIVLPGPLLAGKGPFAPKIGDYCVVVYQDKLYPAIVGDAGPSYKIGEASLRICKALNAAASGLNRPVNDLKVTYLVFPGSGDKPWDAPNLEKWQNRCAELLNEVGGFQGELFVWEDLTKPAPTPTPSPAESPEVKESAFPKAEPSASPKPGVSPAS
jgi:hypothetical protein